MIEACIQAKFRELPESPQFKERTREKQAVLVSEKWQSLFYPPASGYDATINAAINCKP